MIGEVFVSCVVSESSADWFEQVSLRCALVGCGAQVAAVSRIQPPAVMNDVDESPWMSRLLRPQVVREVGVHTAAHG